MLSDGGGGAGTEIGSQVPPGTAVVAVGLSPPASSLVAS
jgi:hypothetical protein